MDATRTSLTCPFADAVERVKNSLKDQGFGTLSVIDVQATLKEKIGLDIEPYTILGVCNPVLASQALAIEHEIGVLMPCTVLVHECGGKVNISAENAMQIVSTSGNQALEPIAREANERIAAALASLQPVGI